MRACRQHVLDQSLQVYVQAQQNEHTYHWNKTKFQIYCKYFNCVYTAQLCQFWTFLPRGPVRGPSLIDPVLLQEET
jgi:hypothetical protein